MGNIPMGALYEADTLSACQKREQILAPGSWGLGLTKEGQVHKVSPSGRHPRQSFILFIFQLCFFLAVRSWVSSFSKLLCPVL